MSVLLSHRGSGLVVGVLLAVLAVEILVAQQPSLRFGGAYSELDECRRLLLDDWVARFDKATGQSLDARSFYDEILGFSTKTTFDAVTHALMTTPLTACWGQKFSDGLALIERVDTVKGEVSGASGDHQFRMYVRLMPNAREMLERSQEFKRGIDNAVYHKGYLLNYREQSGAPSIQVSIALDGHQADIDVDYRSSTFPVMLFNGHLSASNSDVRAGDNAERHAAQWIGFQNWWRGFFGVGVERAPDTPGTTSALALPKIPRAGRKDIKVMVPDFLQAWLVEGDAVAAMGYVCGTVLRVSGAGYARSIWLRPRPCAVSDPRQSESRLRRPWQTRVARGPDDRRAPDDPWASRSAPASSSPVRHLRRARRSCGQVRLREPADAWRADEEVWLRPPLWCDLPHRRARQGHLDRITVGQGGRLLEDRVLADGAGARRNAGPTDAARTQGRPDQGRPSPRDRGEKFRGNLVDSQELRCGVSISFGEKLRVL